MRDLAPSREGPEGAPPPTIGRMIASTKIDQQVPRPVRARMMKVAAKRSQCAKRFHRVEALIVRPGTALNRLRILPRYM